MCLEKKKTTRRLMTRKKTGASKKKKRRRMSFGERLKLQTAVHIQRPSAKKRKKTK